MKKFNRKEFLFDILIVVFTIATILALLTLAVMLLWNMVMAKVVLCDTITFWQALGLIVLISLLTFDKSKLFNWIYE